MPSRSVQLWAAGYWLFAACYLFALLLPWETFGFDDLDGIAGPGHVGGATGSIELLLLLATLSLARMAHADPESSLFFWRFQASLALLVVTALDLLIHPSVRQFDPNYSLGGLTAAVSAGLMLLAASVVRMGGLGGFLEYVVPESVRLDRLVLEERGLESTSDD